MKRLVFAALVFLAVSGPALAGIEPGFLARFSDDVFWPGGDAAPATPEGRELASVFVARDRPMIAIIIDDMGLDRKRSARALDLPAPVTMAYLPYAREVRKQVKEAREKGHEILVHMPMQPGRETADPGPDHLAAGLSVREIRRRVIKNLSAFEGYIGVNNHMGSHFTCCAREGLEELMEELASRGLIFLDSKTSPRSIAGDVAREHGLTVLDRDVFIDDEETFAFTESALRRIERKAQRQGYAVAIGHPRDITLKALKAWIPTLEKKGFQLVPISAVAARTQQPVRTATALRTEQGEGP